jgi:hypothetical protein
MIRIIINGKTEFEGEATEYVSKPPDLFKDAIKPGSQPAPWLKSVAVVFVEAAQSGAACSICVTVEPKRWVMEVSAL